jgi:hypothetical protein
MAGYGGEDAMACACVSEDAAEARAAQRRAEHTRVLIDESHVRISVRRCAECGRRFLACFCEYVDWADGDDPQTWVAAEVSEAEAAALESMGPEPSEEEVLALVPGVGGVRRVLIDERPKGGGGGVRWEVRGMWVPGHD